MITLRLALSAWILATKTSHQLQEELLARHHIMQGHYIMQEYVYVSLAHKKNTVQVTGQNHIICSLVFARVGGLQTASPQICCLKYFF